MAAARKPLWIAAWIVSLIVVSLVSSGAAQRSGEPVPTKVFTGDEFGFRVDALRDNKALGQLVVRVNGQWVEVGYSGRVVPVK